MMRAALTALAIATAAIPARGQSMSERLNDYPPRSGRDYVFGCMAANGPEPGSLEQMRLLDRCDRIDPAL